LHSVACEPVQVLQGFERSLTGQAIQGPEEQHIEPVLTGVFEHVSELGAIGMVARDLIDVFGYDLPAKSAGELTELVELVISLLLVGADPRVQSTLHSPSLSRQ
jgi:uncharacterized membrane protein